MLVKQNINAKAVRFPKKNISQMEYHAYGKKKIKRNEKMEEEGIRTTIYTLRLINEELCTLV